MFRKILLVLAIALVIIQFFHPDKNTDESTEAEANDISKVLNVPETVQNILQTSCYDCHSNNTNYPWYAELQPVAWWLNDHIVEGKGELNFNEFSTYSLRRQYHKLEEIIEQVKEGEMPLSSYTIIHKDAKLSTEQKASLHSWASASMDSMKAHYPADSLLRKK
ncbi:MAG TPA: heme-binding domain-containing protein [Ferruginibacter sp.]|nr:heme-binding domain-containing protein [Ferruginibacter sp.]HPH90835.1 heme-binding domain-containing protein [Ferruginibacter sp.]